MLYAVMLGGHHPKASLELHDLVFVEGDSLAESYPRLRELWFASPSKLHIDGWMEIAGVDGHRLSWSPDEPATDALRLYFIHYGGYEAQAFGEAHRCELVVARTAAEAKAIGKRRLPAAWLRPHKDAIVDLTARLSRAGRWLCLEPGSHAPIVRHSDYIVL